MKCYGFISKGKVFLQKYVSLPSWTADDEGRVIYVEADSTLYVATSASWEAVGSGGPGGSGTSGSSGTSGQAGTSGSSGTSGNSGTSGSSGTSGISGSGLIANTISSTPTSLSAGQCAGYSHYVTYSGATVINLPAVSGVTDGSYFICYMKTAYTLAINPDDNDRIILNGITLADGNRIISDGSVGNFITLHKDGIDGWTMIGRSGYWIDGGA